MGREEARLVAVCTNPSRVASLDVGSCRLKSTWLSFQEGLGFSTQLVSKWKAATAPAADGLEAFAGVPSTSPGKPLDPSAEAY